MDHATGCVVGETATIGDDVSILQGVGLMYRKKAIGIRIQDNVLIGARSTILGNIIVGSGAMIAAGSLVLKAVPANGMVALKSSQSSRKNEDQDRFGDANKNQTREDSKEFYEILAKAVVEKDKSLMAATMKMGPNLSAHPWTMNREKLVKVPAAR